MFDAIRRKFHEARTLKLRLSVLEEELAKATRIRGEAQAAARDLELRARRAVALEVAKVTS